jgi:hypothetical protein
MHLLGVAPNPPTDSRFFGYFKGFFADSTSTKKAIQCMKLRLYCYPNNLLKSLLSFLSLWASSFFARLQSILSVGCRVALDSLACFSLLSREILALCSLTCDIKSIVPYGLQGVFLNNFVLILSDYYKYP